MSATQTLILASLLLFIVVTGKAEAIYNGFRKIFNLEELNAALKEGVIGKEKKKKKDKPPGNGIPDPSPLPPPPPEGCGQLPDGRYIPCNISPIRKLT